MKRFYLYIFLVLLITPSFSQELNFEKIELKGLPSTETYQIIQDKEGFIWIATDAGVCRYDGNTLRTFTIKDGLPENVVLNIKEDSQKRVWFMSLSGSFFYYEKGKFIQIAANKKLKKINGNNTFGMFYFGEKDTLLVPNDGLLKIPPQNNYEKIITQSGEFFSNTTRYILKNNANSQQAIDGYGLLPLPGDSIYKLFLFDTIIQVSAKGINRTFSSPSNFNTTISADGTILFVNRNKLITLKDRKPGQCYYFPRDILKLYIDKDNDLWVCTKKNGLYFYKNADLTKVPIHCLTTLSVSSVKIDKEGTVWASTLENGIFQCMNKYVYCITEKANDLKINNHELTVAFASQKELLVSAKDSLGSIHNLNLLPKSGELISFVKNKYAAYYAFDERLFLIKNNSVTEIFRNHNTQTIRPTSISHEQEKADERQKYVLTKSLIEYTDDTLLGYHSGHLYKIFHSIIPFVSVPTYTISFITRLPDGRVLIGCRSNLGLFEFKGNRTVPFLNNFKELKTRINWVTVDSSGNLWIATNEKGLYCYDTKKQLHVFDESKGLISNKINSCAATPDGDIWCGTHSGISKLTASSDFQKIKIENFDKNHGIIDLEVEKIVWFNNSIWCAGKKAFFFFPTDKMKKNNSAPDMYLKSINASNKNFPLTTDTLFLNYDQNDFHVQFGSISSKKVNVPVFFYKLDGYDKNWRISNTGDIQYTNIGYGTYTLLVFGTNNDGIRSTSPLKIIFVIRKPFWFTWWFITFMSILFLALIALVARYWKHKIEKKERDKAAINQQLAEFKMTALRSQMNPHFIYNAIGSIQHYILKNEIDQSFNYLSKFSSLIRKILNNSRNEFISLEDEISTLKLYIELEQIRFKHPFKFILTIDEELDMDVDIPTMLIQPYIENSIWHGLMPKDKDGCLELTLKKVNSSVNVQIKDNGVGRETGEMKKKHHVSKGMSLTEQRIQTLENTSNKKFVTTITDLKDGNGNPIGTLVYLIIPFDE